MWWGESLMSTYWCILSSEMEAIGRNQIADDLPYIDKGMLYYAPQHQQSIDSPNFFKFNYRFLGNTSYENEGVYPGMDGYSDNLTQLAKTEAYPDIWESSDKLAKSVYSTIMIDLGQRKEQTNILTDPKLLQDYTKVFGVFQNKYGTFGHANPGPAIESYNILKDSTGPLGTNASVINVEYLCQVPRQKSAINLLISILVADAVFIQATWQLFKWLVGLFFLRKDSTAQYCEGCLSLMQGNSGRGDYSPDPHSLMQEKGVVYSKVRSLRSENASDLSDQGNTDERDGSTETLRCQDE